MKRAYFIYTFMLCLTIQVFAQQTTGERIKSIKENPEYLYTESKGESWGDTEDSAKKLLEEKIVKYLTENNMKIDPAEIENAARNADVIEVEDGDNAHIFCYLHIQDVSTDYLITETQSTSIPPAAEEKQDNEESKATVVIPPTSQPQQPVNPVEIPQNQEILKSIILTENTEALNNLLFKLKDQHSIIYGRIKYMTAPEKSYILIFNEKKERIAILDKGTEIRKNLLTGQVDDKISNYKGMRAIWFQLFE